ncbi:hypothetical protein DICA3_F14422 [Diutina catenulata]
MIRNLIFKRFNSKLMANPLEVKNAHIIRESATQFPKPNLLSFDGFGTLYVPRTPVPEQYHEVGKSMGFNVDIATLETRFKDAYARLSEQHPMWGKSSMRSADDWWTELVADVFKLDKSDNRAAKLSDALVEHFTTKDAYKVYDDVIPTLTALKDANIPLVLSSNSDPRVYKLLENLGLKEFFGDEVFLSYELEVEKPNRQFFQHIASTKYGASKPFDYDFLEGCWHVGDSYNADFLGSVRSGWNGILLDRERTSEFLAAKDRMKASNDGCFMSANPGQEENPDTMVIANNRVIIGGLDQLRGLFGV